MAWKLMAAKFAGSCMNCKGRVAEGEQVEWERGTGVRHLNGCAPRPAAEVPAVASRGKLMNARYDGKCASCKGSLAAGSLIDYVRGQGAFHAGVCPEPAEQAEQVEVDRIVPNGRFTVTLDGPDDKVYLRVRSWKGVQMLLVLPTGPERGMHRSFPNQKWIGFATLRGADVLPWRNSDVSDRVLLAATQLTDPGAWQQFGEAYAVEFRRCFRCDAELRDPPSLTTSVGPDCRKELGIAEPTKEEIEIWLADHQAVLDRPVQEVLA